MFCANDFPMLKKSMIYLDNGATTFKPQCVIDSTIDYYSNYTSNAHRGDYDISYIVNEKYEEVRHKVKRFINAKRFDEIIFTSGSTQSLNMIVNGYFKYYLNDFDEVLITKSEHASNVLPWFELSKEKNIKINYIDLDNKYKVNLESVKNSITSKTKVISIAHITNVIGDERPIKEIIEYAHSKGILVVIDGAQSVPHIKVDVQDMDIDFLVFSAHKMCGPTGVGILYGKYELLYQMKPQNIGGGMNSLFSSNIEFEYKILPHKLEAGTPNIAGIIAFGSAIDYINNIGIENIDVYVKNLKKYATKKLSILPNIEIYNKDIEGSIIAFNIRNIPSEKVAEYLNKMGICIRAGTHCAKILKDELKVSNTCRASLYFYNNKEDIDILFEALNNMEYNN